MDDHAIPASLGAFVHRAVPKRDDLMDDHAIRAVVWALVHPMVPQRDRTDEGSYLGSSV